MAVRWRLVAIGMLIAAAGVLFMADRVNEKIERRSAIREAQNQPLLKEVNLIIDSLLGCYQIDPKWIKSWNVLTPDKKFIREEHSIFVPSDFISLDFNHDLSRELAKYDVQVVATERTKESTVSMHIISNKMVIESLSFVVKRSLP